MEVISLQSLNIDPVGRSIANVFSFLEKGDYAFAPSSRNAGRTDVLVFAKSAGTNFYRYLTTVNFPFDGIEKSNLIQKYPVERNASPAGSDCQEYEMNALPFVVE